MLCAKCDKLKLFALFKQSQFKLLDTTLSINSTRGQEYALIYDHLVKIIFYNFHHHEENHSFLLWEQNNCRPFIFVFLTPLLLGWLHQKDYFNNEITGQCTNPYYIYSQK